MREIIDIAGQRFGRLTAIKRLGSPPKCRGSIWLVRCDCGNEREVYLGNLRKGRTTSCGCYRRERVIEGSYQHGQSKTVTHNAWCAMFDRCNNPNNKRFNRYGGRGIKVCARWHTFEHFLADMGERPDGLSIDRIDNDGDYEPGNCRWATPHQQARNTSRNKHLTYNGITLCQADWAKTLGVTPMALVYRLRHWPYDKVFTSVKLRPGPSRKAKNQNHDPSVRCPRE